MVLRLFELVGCVSVSVLRANSRTSRVMSAPVWSRKKSTSSILIIHAFSSLTVEPGGVYWQILSSLSNEALVAIEARFIQNTEGMSSRNYWSSPFLYLRSSIYNLSSVVTVNGLGLSSHCVSMPLVVESETNLGVAVNMTALLPTDIMTKDWWRFRSLQFAYLTLGWRHRHRFFYQY